LISKSSGYRLPRLASIRLVFPPHRTGPHLILVAADAPNGECTPAQHPEAEVLDNRGHWERVTVLAWHKLEKPIRQRITFCIITWLVQLQQEDGSVGWYEHTDDMRPINEPGSTGSSSSSDT
jgi:hypothetical protein